MYLPNSLTRLEAKCEYEVWLLQFLWNKFEYQSDNVEQSIIFEDGHVTSKLEAFSSISFLENLKTFQAMNPLYFITCYKFLDMVIEWVIEENVGTTTFADKRPPSQWPFITKVAAVQTANIIYPPAIENHPFIKNFLKSLYITLKDVRNQIIHRHNYEVQGDHLLIYADSKQQRNITITTDEIVALVQILLLLNRLIMEGLHLTNHQNLLLAKWLDQISHLHDMGIIGGTSPRIIRCQYLITNFEGFFPVNLEWVLDTVNRVTNGNYYIILEVVARMEHETIRWNFTDIDIPSDCNWVLYNGCSPDKRI